AIAAARQKCPREVVALVHIGGDHVSPLVEEHGEARERSERDDQPVGPAPRHWLRPSTALRALKTITLANQPGRSVTKRPTTSSSLATSSSASSARTSLGLNMCRCIGFSSIGRPMRKRKRFL